MAQGGDDASADRLPEDETPHQGFANPELSVHVPASVNAVTIPAEFLEADTEYEIGVLAIEESGNQTIAVVPFVTQ